MKSIFSSSETFDAYAEIDYWYFILETTNKSFQKLSPIEKLIDLASGYDKAHAKNITKIIRRIIRLKEKIGADTKLDKEFLKKLVEAK